MINARKKIAIALLCICWAGIDCKSAEPSPFPVIGSIEEPSKLLDGKPATANWIWSGADVSPVNQYLIIQKSVTLPEVADSIVAYISAYSFADVYINGKLLDRCPINSDPEYQVYEKYDLSVYFKKGKNLISALVYNYGIGMHHRIRARGGFFFSGQSKFWQRAATGNKFR